MTGGKWMFGTTEIINMEATIASLGIKAGSIIDFDKAGFLVNIIGPNGNTYQVDAFFD
jgi:hypothetical protein